MFLYMVQYSLLQEDTQSRHSFINVFSKKGFVAGRECSL